MTTRKWVNKDGVDQYTTEVVADQMQMLGGKTAEANEPAAKAKSDGGYRAMKEGTFVPMESDFNDPPF
jgi:single-strand DNA-binding protein